MSTEYSIQSLLLRYKINALYATIHKLPTIVTVQMTTNAAMARLCPLAFCVLSETIDIITQMAMMQANVMYTIGLIIPTVSTHVVRKLNMLEKNPMTTLSLRLPNPSKNSAK